jgi:LuxR family maltose regulon positive regulatory protein
MEGSQNPGAAAGGAATPSVSGRDQGSPVLTDREADVLDFLPTRLSTSEIARSLQISPNTVKTHLNHIYRKLGVRDRNEAILRAAAWTLLPPESTAVVR